MVSVLEMIQPFSWLHAAMEVEVDEFSNGSEP